LPVTIDRRPATGGVFTAVPASGFAAYLSNDNARSIMIGSSQNGPGFEPGFQYRIRPTPQLVSDVPALPKVVWDFDYIIMVQPGAPLCAGDVNETGHVDVDDLLAVIASWGNPPPPSMPGVDANGNGIVNVDDLLIVINTWGACG
jgi:hypothetical protein